MGLRFKVTDRGDVSTLAFAGIDALKVFSGPTGDWGTLQAQIYLTRIDDYRILCCSYSAGATGPFRLTIRER